MRLIRLTVATLALCLAAQSGGAEPVISKTYSYFSIGGRTGEELERELSRRGPMLAETGTRHAGATRIRIAGSVKYENTGRKCRVIDSMVTLETRLMLPRWSNRKRADPHTALIWDTLSSDIKRHEERHAEIARQYARELEKSIESLRPESTCAKMEARVAAVTQSIIKRHGADQDRFDRTEALNFERRMLRMLRYKASQRQGG